MIAELIGELVLGMTWMGIYYKAVPSARSLLGVGTIAAIVLGGYPALTLI